MEAQTDHTEPKAPKPLCKNCGKKLSKKGSFCPSCGQRDFDGRIKMRDLLARFFSNFTHLDNKFVKMCWQLLVPAKVTLHYFEGKIKRYPHPVQFFFIVMFFFLLMFSKPFESVQLDSTGGNFSLHVGGGDSTQSAEMKKRLEETGVYGTLEHYVAARKYRAQYDSMPLEWRTPTSRLLLDSVVRKVDGPWEETAKLFLSLGKEDAPKDEQAYDSLTMNMIFSSATISVDDLINLPVDTISQRYGFKDWDQLIALRQGIKSLKDPQRLIHQYVGSFGWAILVLIAIMAFVLRLLYWRSGRYYVEHFIFLMHQQSGAFLLLTLGLVVNEYLFHLNGAVWLLLFAWIGTALLLAMKKIYRETWAWTVAKWLLYCLIYLIGLCLLFVATLLVVFVLF